MIFALSRLNIKSKEIIEAIADEVLYRGTIGLSQIMLPLTKSFVPHFRNINRKIQLGNPNSRDDSERVLHSRTTRHSSDNDPLRFSDSGDLKCDRKTANFMQILYKFYAH